MELGGNSPFLVLHDADLDVAIAGAMAAKMRNGGEACTAANRFLVHEPVAEAFTARPGRRDGRGPRRQRLPDGAQLGPLINARRARQGRAAGRRRASSAARACARGGERAAGRRVLLSADGARPRPAGSAILAEEVFGPVAPVMTFADEDEAHRARQRHRVRAGGLRVQPRPAARDLRSAKRMETGMVGLNRGVVSDPAAPFGGAKQSGIGREGGHHGLLGVPRAQVLRV